MEDPPPPSDLDATEAHGLVAQVLQPASSERGLEGEVEIPGIEILHRIGQGGMGEVYFAIIEDSGEEVAVKVLNPATDSDPLSAERFIREGEALDRLDHPNLLKIRGRGELSDGRPYLITDYAEGGTLDDRLRKGERLEEATIIQYTRELCAGLAAVHATGLVHRDIKPSNLLFDGAGHLIVADFGLAKVLQLDLTELTLSGTSLGTASYMAPEQGIPGSAVDARADIFAIGVVLYKMLTGDVPKGQFKPPSSFGRSRAWDRIVARCLATSPEDRYSNAAELERAIDRIRADSPGRRTVIAAGCGAAAALVGGGYWARSARNQSLDSKWVDLLPTFAVTPPWSRKASGDLVCEERIQSAAVFAEFDVGESYELRFTWRRLEGEASLAAFLPTARGLASFEMGAWRRDLAGIQAIDGQTLLDPGSHSMRQEFANDVSYDLTVTVGPETIVFSIDDAPQSTVDIAGKRLEIVDSWENIGATRIGFGAWQCRAVFSRLEYRVL